jgi:hypothetical protein
VNQFFVDWIEVQMGFEPARNGEFTGNEWNLHIVLVCLKMM